MQIQREKAWEISLHAVMSRYQVDWRRIWGVVPNLKALAHSMKATLFARQHQFCLLCIRSDMTCICVYLLSTWCSWHRCMWWDLPCRHLSLHLHKYCGWQRLSSVHCMWTMLHTFSTDMCLHTWFYLTHCALEPCANLNSSCVHWLYSTTPSWDTNYYCCYPRSTCLSAIM